MVAVKKVDVTVLKGTVNDGEKNYGPGEVLKMNPGEAEELIDAGVIVNGIIEPEKVIDSEDDNEGTGEN